MKEEPVEPDEETAQAYLRRICKHGMRRNGVCLFCGQAVTSLPAENTKLSEFH